MKIYNIPQHLEDGTTNEEWLSVRAGKFTASDFHQYMAIVEKDKLSDSAETALHKKVLQGLGESFDSYTSDAMARGTMLEPEARELYIQETFNDVQEVGFVDWEQLRTGVSPDGVIYGADGKIEKIVELKSPEIVAYLKYAQGVENIPPLYRTQVQMQMLVTGAKSCDFVAYHPNMRLVVYTIDADADYQAKIVAALEKLNTRYDEILETIKKLKIGD